VRLLAAAEIEMENVMSRSTITKMHLILAAFMLPVTLLFLVTGAFYTWGITGSYDRVVYQVPLDRPLDKDETALMELARAELARRDLDEPTGNPRIRTAADGYKLEWAGSRRDVWLEPTSDPLLASFTVLDTTWYRNLVQLHKAKGGVVFKTYAAALSVALVMMLSTGVLLAWNVPKFRPLVSISALAGIVTCIAAMAVS
jgi:hypothetical protein